MSGSNSSSRSRAHPGVGMQSLRIAGDVDDDDEAIPFQGLDKGLVLQDTKAFGNPKTKPRYCCQLITKILYLVIQGDQFTKKEATDCFFAATKLFFSKEIQLRRMVYLVLKELAPLADQDNVIIVIASLTKDMNSTVETYRANSIRVLCRIMEASMLQQVERLFKQAIVDKDPYVASAALVSGVHLIRVGPDIVKRWVNEVTQALASKSNMVQYHALGLLHQIKKHDRLAVTKLVASMAKRNIRSPYAHCMLIRFAAQVMAEDQANSARIFFDYLEQCLRHKSEIVIYEAARAICALPNVTSRELTPAITVLQLFLSSPKATLRFAAVRTLNRVAMFQPVSVATCNLDMETLITDVNRSIATLAITTLLKTGSASSVDRLMKQISTFMSDITDEFKIVVVDAIRALALKFPEKHRALMTFLSTTLRDEGGFTFKKSIVEAILDIVKAIPESKEAGLTHLCEFIEDCEFPYLSIKILNLLGAEGPATTAPSKFIRYIYNRVSLENPSVRAAAISALAKFGVQNETLRPSISVLLRRCMHDSDDEVRDRATLYLNLVEGERETAKHLVLDDFTLPVVNLEKALLDYCGGKAERPFSLADVSTEVREVPGALPPREATGGGLLNATREPEQVTTSFEMYKEQLAAVPQLFDVGELFSSSKPVPLSESETEYVVVGVKHVFPEHIVFQYTITNTLSDQLLENVTVAMESDALESPLQFEFDVPLPKLQYGEPGVAYVCYRRETANTATYRFTNTLKFIVKDLDPQTGEPDEEGYEDEYQLEDIQVVTADNVRPTFVSNFGEQWEELGDDNEVVETYALQSTPTLQSAVDEVTSYLGMQAAERSDKVPDKKKKHILYLSGLFVGNVPVLVRVRMRLDPNGAGVNMELTVRSSDENVSQSIALAVG